MGKIYVNENLGNSVPNPQRGGATAGGQPMVAQAIGSLAQIGADVATKVANNDRALKVAQRSTNASMELEEFVFGLKQDRDYGTQYDRYQQFVGDLDKKYKREFAGDGLAYDTWKAEFGQFAFKKGFGVRSDALTGHIDQQKAGLTFNLSQLSELAVAGDEEQQALVKTKANLLLQNAYNSGVLTAEETAKGTLDFQDEVTGAQVRKDILDDPDNAADKLLQGQYSGLSGEKQMMWLEKANQQSEANLRKQISQQERLTKEQRRAEKAVAENMSKAGDKLLAAGELTEEWIEANRDDIDPEDYRYFYKSLRSGDNAATDPVVYSDLRQRASNGDDVREVAREELRKGRLKTMDYERLVNRSERNAGSASVPNWYKRGEQYIGRSLQVSDVNPDPAAAQRQAAAMNDWQDWADANPSATNDDAQKTYKRIVNEYALLNYQDMTLTKRWPQYGVGSRDAIDVQASMQSTVDAFKRGEITQDEFEKQAALLKDWEAAAARMNQGGTDAAN
jgi:uncharacterized membrane protein